MQEGSLLVLPGPWTTGFVLHAPLRLRSKSNFRRSHRGSDSAWSDASSFERDLGLLVRQHRPAAWDLGDPDKPLAERPVVVSFIAARSTIDVANFSKSVLDALEGVLYVSDASVLASGAVGSRGRTDSSLFLGFAQLGSGAGPVDAAAALAALGCAVTAEFAASSASS
jgi:hypothetical protein